MRCPLCSNPVQPDEKVFLDIINTVIHQKCYYQSSRPRWKGAFSVILFTSCSLLLIKIIFF
ncbi:hypothetical protein B6A27_16080 [Anoxybacillus sp. UARK-01]|nr:hypothetical protein B6A27_16080 [Anoxybacillus sp. UARK-01]